MFSRFFSFLLNPRARLRPRPTLNGDGDEQSRPQSRLSWRDILFNLPLLLGGLVVLGLILVVLFGPLWATHDPHITALSVIPHFDAESGQMVRPPFLPSDTHPFGTDNWGNDMLSLLLYGARVTLVSGPVGFSAPQGVDRIDVRSALEMHAAVMARAAAADIFIGVAAVADYRVANAAEHKLKKDTGGIPPIELIENPDILAEVAALKGGPFCVGFAAESQNLEAYAQAKRRKKNIPLIAGNLIQDGFGGDDNRLVLFDDAGVHPLNPAAKSVLARQLIEHIATLTGKN